MPAKAARGRPGILSGASFQPAKGASIGVPSTELNLYYEKMRERTAYYSIHKDVSLPVSRNSGGLPACSVTERSKC